MISFIIHDEESVPDGSKDKLLAVKKQMGFIPNLIAVLSESPATLNTYLYGMQQVQNKGNFDQREISCILLAVSKENKCEYCLSAHAIGAVKQGLEQDEVDNIVNDRFLSNYKYNILVSFTRALVRERGFVNDKDVYEFFTAGYEHHHMLEVVLLTGLKTITNYVNHLGQTNIDEEFKSDKISNE